MPFYTLNRNHLLTSTLGVISFKKNEPVFVPDIMVKEVLLIGAEPVEGEKPDLLPPEESPNQTPVGNDRVTQLNLAFDLITEANVPGDFTGSGIPTVKAVEKIVGFDVTRDEVAKVWGDYKLAKAE